MTGVQTCALPIYKAQGWFVPAVKCLYFYAPYGGILSETSFEEDYLSASAMSQPINRYDMAQMLGAVLLYGRIEAQDSQKSAAHTKIGDWSAVPPIYQSAVASCYALGIIGGQSDGTFGGNNTMNRAQGCVVIHRMLSLANGGTIPQPSTPAETPTQSGVGTLANGKPITEENVLEIIEQIKLQYPSGMEWNSNTHRTGLPSAAANKLQGLYWSSNMGGCGGFASLVSDTIFGAGDANPIRKVPFTEMRPGDILIKCSPDGKCMHWTTAASRITGTDSYDFDDPSIGSSEDMPGGMNYLYLATTYGGNESSHVRYGLNSLTETPQPAYPYYYEVWTRYPE